jgi:subtilisin family serine protease
MALNSFGGFGRGMSGIGHGTGRLGAGGAVNGLGALGDRIHVRIPDKVNVPDQNIRVRTGDSGPRGATGAGGKLDERPGSRRGHRIVYRSWSDGPECGGSRARSRQGSCGLNDRAEPQASERRSNTGDNRTHISGSNNSRSAGSNNSRSAGSNNGRSGGVPPRGERRFVSNEVITAFSPGASAQSIAQIARRYNLSQIESQSFPLIGRTLYRWRIANGRSVVNVLGALGNERSVANAQPNYIFTSLEQSAKVRADERDDAAQYVLAKMQVQEAQQVATGKDIPVAVIDSEIDVKHPDLDGAIVKNFDGLGGKANPHQHGTAMAGAIAAHGKLLGIAPDAKLLAARAFGDAPGRPEGTSFAIYKSLQWAADNGARVVNMSFAGPADPALHRILTGAYEKGEVLIAAAGNAGPNSAPLYPAADPSVIAVTATDYDDGLFRMANRGQYIAVAAPGVEVLALAPGESYQITTGTSVAAAHVSAIAALLLERKPSLKPGDIRTILMTTAKPLTSMGQHSAPGTGLVNAYRAVKSLNVKSVGADGHDEQAE